MSKQDFIKEMVLLLKAEYKVQGQKVAAGALLREANQIYKENEKDFA